MRAPEQIVAAMAVVARLSTFDERRTWYDALFEPGADGTDGLSRPDRPDRALLWALAKEYADMDAHLAALPDKTHEAWLKQILGIARLPAESDQIVAHVTVDPKLAPAVVPKDTMLRGGKDAFGNERRYRTLDPLSAHGAALVGVRSLVPGGTAPGLPGVAGRAPGSRLIPPDGDDAPHKLRVYSTALSFEGGDLTVRMTFGSASNVDSLAAAAWRCSQPDGELSDPRAGTVSGSAVTVRLTGRCGTADGTTPWIEGTIPATVPAPEEVAFSSVSVQVARTPYAPQAAFYNDGAVDITKEFQPFGAAAKRGDAFYLRSDEAFGKRLATVTVVVTLMQSGGIVLSASTGGSGVPSSTSKYVQAKVAAAKSKLGSMYSAVEEEFGGIVQVLTDAGRATVRWQRRVDGQWSPLGPPSSYFGSVTASVGGLGSERFALAGQEGHYIRAFLFQGDFGWTKYQADIADFATKAVKGDTTDLSMPTVPVPPIASGIAITYTTMSVPADRVESTRGWRRAIMPDTGLFHPFRRAVSDTGASGMVAIGLEIPDAALGSTVSLYLDVDSASPCGATDPVRAHWEWWDESRWRDLAVTDGSRELRDAGLLRFVAPPTWLVGCSDVGEDVGRWIRLVTHTPERLGKLRDVVVDAVTAEFVSRAADPRCDPSSAAALPPRTIKGTLSPIRGVRKVTNLASVRGRGPESDEDYLRRGSARARHRDRAIAPWDYEQRVMLAFPEVAAALCLPHTAQDGTRAPGRVGLVVIPDRPFDPAPRPSVSLIERIIEEVSGARSIGAQVAVLCPLYVPVTVVATISLRAGIAALTGKEAITAALEAVLHPTSTSPTRWGRALYASALISFLERQPSVDVVTSFQLRDLDADNLEMVEVDPCRGLYCSSASHEITCEELL